MAPVFSILLSAAFLHTRLTTSTIAGTVVALAGASLVSMAGGAADLSVGALVVLAAALAQGTYHVAIMPLLSRYTGFEVACYAMWSGTILLLPLLPTGTAGPSGRTTVGDPLGRLPRSAAVRLGFVTWSYAVARLPVAQSTAALYLVPPVVVVVAFLWLGERPRLLELLGGLIAIAGVVIVHRGRPGATPPGSDDGPHVSNHPP